MPRQPMRVSSAIVLLLANSLSVFDVLAGPAQDAERVVAIAPPSTPLPPEAQSRDVTRFSFIAYGATRGRPEGLAIQYEHSLILDPMLAPTKPLLGAEFPRP